MSYIPNFSSLSLYDTIDPTHHGITSGQLIAFLTIHNERVSKEVANDVIYTYDADKDGRLDLEEFSVMTLPCDNRTLRDVASNRNGYVDVEVKRKFNALLIQECKL